MLPGVQPPPNCFASDLQHQQLYSRSAVHQQTWMTSSEWPSNAGQAISWQCPRCYTEHQLIQATCVCRILHVVAATPVLAHMPHITPHPAATDTRYFLD